MIPVAFCMPLLKSCLVHPMIGHVVNPVTANAVVDHSSVPVAVKFIPGDAVSVIPMHSFMVKMVAVFPAAQTEETLVEVPAINKDESVFTKVKVIIKSHPDAVEQKTAYSKVHAYR